MSYFLIAIFAGLVWFFGLYLFNKLKIFDTPWPDIIPPRKPVPNVQWLFLFIWVVLSILLFFPEYIMQKEIIGFLLAWLLIILVSLKDSFKSMNPKIRLLVQILVGLVAFAIGGVGIYELVLPWWEVLYIPIWLSVIVTVVWFAGFMNAINWFDGINSLASGVSSIWFLSIILLIQLVVLPHYSDISAENLAVLEMVLNLSYILFVFSFVYSLIEFKPFGVLRDVWVMFLWFALAYLALLWWAKIGTIVVALSLVVFDSIWVFVNRIFVLKKNPLKWDYTHLHHRLLALNWNRTEVRFFVRWWSLFLMIIMILLWADRLSKLIIFVLMFLIFFWINAYLFWYKKLPYHYLKREKES